MGLGLGMGDAADRLAEARVPRGVRELRELEAERAWLGLGLGLGLGSGLGLGLANRG